MRRTPAQRLAAATAGAALTAVGITTATAPSATATSPTSDPFYSYTAPAPLASFAPGTVLDTRTLHYHVLGIPTPVTVVQLLYRTTDAQGRPTANVTSVIRSLTGDPSKAVSYQSFYDSLNPADSPSRAIAGGVSLGGAIANAETLFIAPLLLQGYNVVIPDTEGQTADFAAGPEYATDTLDAIRAATHSAATGMDPDTRFGLLGYSGGAIATGWAAATTWDKWVTDRPVKTAKGVIEPGRVAAVHFTINGIYQGRTRIQLEHVNRVGRDSAPDWPRGNTDDVYRVEIEGSPSIVQETAFRFTDGSGRDAATAGCLATGLRALNAVPAVNAAAPGWVTALDLPLIPGAGTIR